jgi:hypothetical protein
MLQARQRRECAASLRVVCDMKAKLMQRREGLDSVFCNTSRHGSSPSPPGKALSLLPHSSSKMPREVSPIRSGISCSSGNPRSASCLSTPSLPSPLGSVLSLLQD